jgi:hypothetical protein
MLRVGIYGGPMGNRPTTSVDIKVVVVGGLRSVLLMSPRSPPSNRQIGIAW